MRSVVLVSIGPVQPFIAAARRTRDLWAGSTLLSNVATVLARELAAGDAASLVFPAVTSLDELGPGFPVANRVLAVVEGDAGAAAKRACDRARDWLVETARQTFAMLPVDRELSTELALAQVVDLLEIQWVATPFEGEPSWGKARARADELLAQRKATRNFAHPPQRGDSAAHRKSSIDGLRESVTSDDLAGGTLDRRRPYRLAAGEWLCGVSLLKRHVFAEDAARVPSTSGVAAAPTVTRLKRDHAERYQRFREEMRGLGADDEDSWLFEDRLEECVGAAAAAGARAHLRDLLRETKVSPPSPYYALLRADGDRMGKLIGSKDRREDHQALSRDLVTFATKARQLVSKHAGHAIYTGGDDVLALLPVPEALACAAALRKLFGESVQGETLSVGLVVAHHLDPLADTLLRSEQAERHAKVRRDSLAVCIAKRSGSDTLVAGPWGDLDVWLGKLIQLLADERIPAGMAHELRDAAQRVDGADRWKDLEAAEARRILGRKQPRHGQAKALDTDDRAALVKRAASGLGALATELLVARALAPETEGPR